MTIHFHFRQTFKSKNSTDCAGIRLYKCYVVISNVMSNQLTLLCRVPVRYIIIMIILILIPKTVFMMHRYDMVIAKIHPVHLMTVKV